MENILKDNEVIDDLELNNLKIIQNKEWFKFGIDSVLISDFAKKIKNNSKVLDIGSGTGIISILLSAKIKAEKIIGIEIQKEVADMSKRSIDMNDLQNKIEIINDNINNIENYFKENSIDAIVTNPPYQKNNTGLKSDNEKHLISRHEIECTLEDIICKSYKVLKDNGEFYMVHRSERLADIMYLMKKYRIEPKELRTVYPKVGEKANLILIKGVKNAKEFLKVHKPLIVYNDNNIYTDEVLEIYGKKGENKCQENYI